MKVLFLPVERDWRLGLGDCSFHEQCPKPKKSRRVTQEDKDTSVKSNKAAF